jgi:hypothetical protein
MFLMFWRMPRSKARPAILTMNDVQTSGLAGVEGAEPLALLREGTHAL